VFISIVIDFKKRRIERLRKEKDWKRKIGRERKIGRKKDWKKERERLREKKDRERKIAICLFSY